MDRSSFSVKCSTDSLSAIRSFIGTKLKNHCIEDTTLHRIVAAVDEACANAIIHGNQCDQCRKLAVDLEYSDQCVQIDIYDIGDIHTPSLSNNDFNLDHSIRHKKRGGLGLCLIRRLMDEVSYYEKDHTRVCRLKKYLG